VDVSAGHRYYQEREDVDLGSFVCWLIHGYKCFEIWILAQSCVIAGTNISRAVITDPNDPKFDLEAYLTQVQKDSP
jgi:hypothetical protein